MQLSRTRSEKEAQVQSICSLKRSIGRSKEGKVLGLQAAKILFPLEFVRSLQRLFLPDWSSVFSSTFSGPNESSGCEEDLTKYLKWWNTVSSWAWMRSMKAWLRRELALRPSMLTFAGARSRTENGGATTIRVEERQVDLTSHQCSSKKNRFVTKCYSLDVRLTFHEL